MKKLKLSDIDPGFSGKLDKDKTEERTLEILEKMGLLLYEMYADSKNSLLIILQGIDTSGKDGVIRHIFSGTNPQGIQVHSFKEPSDEELRHDFLWRCHNKCPRAGEVAIFNRSYYEEVTTLMVHPKGLRAEHLPDDLIERKDFFDIRYRQINQFEKTMTETGTIIIKFLLHISKAEQKDRLEARLKDPTKNWKFSTADVQERKFWSHYMSSFDKMLKATHTSHAPWHVIPADKKWYRNYLISKIIKDRLSECDFRFPKIKLKSLVIK